MKKIYECLPALQQPYRLVLALLTKLMPMGQTLQDDSEGCTGQVTEWP